MLGVDDARARVLAKFTPLPLVAVPLLDALGLVLGEEVVAPRDVPPFANSAMDGFACRAADLAGATRDAPVWLTIGGTVQAGDDLGARVEPGCAIRIMTGAPLPDGADVVVAFERAFVDDAYPTRVRIRHAYPPHTNTRAAGEDMRRGEVVLPAGRRIRPADIALLAAIGRTHVPVHRRPKVAILATGDEVVAPGTQPGPGQIWDSNSDAIAAMVRQAGGVPVPLGIARDNEAEIRARLAAEPDVDLIVTSGGVSAGDFDLITEILHSDARIAFWQIRIKPGRPLAFGAFGGIPLLGLPGNPVAVAVTFLQFARPAILTMLGRTDLDLPSVQARMLDPVDNGGGRRHYVRVQLSRTASGYEARLAGTQGSALLSTLANADGLLVIPETMDHVAPGTLLPVELPDWDRV
ncbi:MAG: molybdopterin molybdotransferase MoeA [Thermomicrobiales bacterium]|nr:molybdopterin molybdotransferase MoeA [Thermomicrobiales bacterium]